MDIIEVSNQLGIDIQEIFRLKRFNTSLDITDAEAVANAFHIEQCMINNLVATYDKNIAYFKEHQTELYATFANFKPQRSFEFFSSGNGIPNILFEGYEHAFYPDADPLTYCDRQIAELSSSLTYRYQNYKNQEDRFSLINHRYVNEACAILENIPHGAQTDKIEEIGAMPHMTLLGVGLGYIVGSLVERYAIETMILIEPNADLFYASLYTFSWADFLEMAVNQKISVNFIVGRDIPYTDNYLQHYYESSGAFLAEANCLIAHYVDQSIKELLEFYSESFYRYYTMLGYCDDALYGISNTMRSIKDGRALVRSDVKLPEKFVSMPVFVIGNGPSLDEDIAFLRKNQDRALIIACGTALDSLYNAGIKADLYVASERTYHIGQTLEIFEGSHYLDDIIIATACTTHKNTIKHFKDALIFDKYDESIAKMLCVNPEFKGIEKWQDLAGMNPLVGNAGLSVAIHLGFKNIYLFGIDNGRASTVSNLHSKFSDIYGDKYKAREKSDIAGQDLMLEANFGGYVSSNALYRVSRDFLDTLLGSTKVNCINCSNGALLKHARPLKSKDIVLDDLDDKCKEELRAFLLNDKVMYFNVDEAIIKRIFDAKSFESFVDKLIYIVNQALDSRKSGMYFMGVIHNILEQSDIGFGLVLKRIMLASSQYFFMFATRALYTIKDEKTALKTAHEILNRYIYLLLDLKYIYVNFMPDFIEHEHVSLMHGRIGLDHEDSKAPAIDDQVLVLDTKKDGLKKNAFVKRYE